MSDCLYQVVYSPSGCTRYPQGGYINRSCAEPCEDIIILDETECDGAYLMVVSNNC